MKDRYLPITNETDKYKLYVEIRELKRNYVFYNEELNLIKEKISNKEKELKNNKDRIAIHNKKLAEEFNPWLKKQEDKLKQAKMDQESYLQSEPNHERDKQDSIKNTDLLNRKLHELDAEIQKEKFIYEKNKQQLSSLEPMITQIQSFPSMLEKIEYDFNDQAQKQKNECSAAWQANLNSIKALQSNTILSALSASLIEQLNRENNVIKLRIKEIDSENVSKINQLKIIIKKTDQDVIEKSKSRDALQFQVLNKKMKRKCLREERGVLIEKIEKEKNQQEIIEAIQKKHDIHFLDNLQQSITLEIEQQSNKIENFYNALIKEKNNLQFELNELNIKIPSLKLKIDRITCFLDEKICFSSGQAIDEKLVETALYVQLQKTGNTNTNLPKFATELVAHCNWRQLSKGQHADDIAEILLGFYNTIIKDKNRPTDSYYRLFNLFLAQQAISIEHAIAKRDIEKVRALDSMARVIRAYIRNQLFDNIGPVIALTIYDNQIKIAMNELVQDVNRDQKNYQSVKAAAQWLASVINGCPSDNVDEQKCYLSDICKTLHPNFFEGHWRRIPTDLLNILQFHYNQARFIRDHVLLSEQLQAITNDHIYISYDTNQSRPGSSLHAELTLLMRIACDHLLASAKANRELTMLPKDKSLLLGVSKLNCASCYFLIDAINAIQNNIVITGTHYLLFESTHTHIGQRFIERVQAEIMQQYLQGQIQRNDYDRIVTYLSDQSSLFKKSLQGGLGGISFVHGSMFTHTKDKSKLQPRLVGHKHTQSSHWSPHDKEWELRASRNAPQPASQSQTPLVPPMPNLRTTFFQQAATHPTQTLLVVEECLDQASYVSYAVVNDPSSSFNATVAAKNPDLEQQDVQLNQADEIRANKKSRRF